MAKSAIGQSSPEVKKQATHILSDMFWTGRKGRRNRVIRLSVEENGCCPGARWADVDASIARTIAAMNDAGMQTLYCCSGRKIDHESTNCAAYIYAKFPLPVSFTTLLPEGVFLDGASIIRFKECSDRELGRLWKIIGIAVKQYATAKEIFS